MPKRLFILLLLLSSNFVFAQEQPVTPSPLFKPGQMFFNFYFGNYAAAEEPQFVNMHNEFALGFGLSTDFNRYPFLAFDLETFLLNRDYDTPIGPPLWGTIDEETSVQTASILFGLRAFIPQQKPFRAYISVGLGYYQTRMIVYGAVFGFPGIYEDTDNSFAAYYGAGLSYMFDKWGLGLDFRHFSIDGDFAGFNINNAKLGGDVYLVSWKYQF